MTEDFVFEIEHGDTRFDLEFASTTKALLHRLADNSHIQKAQRAIAQNPFLVCTFLERAELLFNRPFEAGYLHPDDMALSAYLFLIGSSGDHDIQNFVRLVASSENRSFRGSVGVAKYMLTKSSTLTVQPAAQNLLHFLSNKIMQLETQRYNGNIPNLSLGQAPSGIGLSNHQRRFVLEHARAL